jgi:hypothetical protein
LQKHFQILLEVQERKVANDPSIAPLDSHTHAVHLLVEPMLLRSQVVAEVWPVQMRRHGVRGVTIDAIVDITHATVLS